MTMKTLLCGTAFLAAVAPAMAQQRYDRNLEKAAVRIVAGRMGDIRGGFSYGQVPQLVVLPAAPPPVSLPAPRLLTEASGGDDGLTPAVERQVSQPEF
jgi:hypothetical protein